MTDQNPTTNKPQDRSLRWGDDLPDGEGQELTDLYREGWAVVVGINDYGGRQPNLANAVNDARAVATLLQDTYGFQHVITLYDEQATQKAILQWLEDDLPKQVKPEDRVVFFFAGHGTTRQGAQQQTRGYLIPQDADTGQYSDYIDMTRLKDACGWIPAKHILLLLDCCFAGVAAVTPRSEPKAPPTALNQTFLRAITQKRAWQVLTAGASDERAADSGSRPGHSAFTSVLLSGLEGQADLNSDGIITASELASYLRPKVSEDSSRGGGKGQTPFFNYLAGSQEGDFVFLKPGKKVILQPEGVIDREIKPVLRQNPWLWAVLAVVVLVVFAGFGSFIYQNLVQKPAEQTAAAIKGATSTAEQAQETMIATAQQGTIEAQEIALAKAATAAAAQQTVQAEGTALAEAGASEQEQEAAREDIQKAEDTATVAAEAAERALGTPEPPTATPTDTPVPTATATPTARIPTATFTPATIPVSTTISQVVQISGINDDIWLDRTEVTNAQYTACVETGPCKPNVSYGGLFDAEDHPVVGVNWEQAKIYCDWRNGRLPKVWEWQLAASSNNSQKWPWGNQDPTCSRAVIVDCTAGHTQPVGSLPSGANPDGIVDLIGNVWEWSEDVDISVDTRRLTLGGSWNNPDGTDKGGFANFNPANQDDYLTLGLGHQSNNQGFRCAYDFDPTASGDTTQSLLGIQPSGVSGDINIVGSTTAQQLTTEVANQYKAEGFTGNIDYQSVGTDLGIEQFCAPNSQIDIAAASHDMYDNQLAICRTNGREPVRLQVAVATPQDGNKFPQILYTTANILNEKPQVAAFLDFYLTHVNQIIPVFEGAYTPADDNTLRESEQRLLDAVK